MGDIFISTVTSPGPVAVFTVDALITAGAPVTEANTTGDSPIPYTAGQLGNTVLVVINSRIQAVGRDVTEVTPASGTFAHIYDLQAGDVIQMIPRAG